MELKQFTPEIQRLLSDTESLGRKENIGWGEIVEIERSALGLWLNKPDLRDTIHHQFTDALARLQGIDYYHRMVVDAVLMLHRIAMHPNTAVGLIDEFIEGSRNFDFSGNLTRQDIESLFTGERTGAKLDHLTGVLA